MSYQSQAALRRDPDLQARVAMCAAQEAKSKIADVFADLALTSPDSAAGLLMPSLITEPGWDAWSSSADIQDAEILSGVQAVWTAVSDLYADSLAGGL